jgi:hypothetical protein
MYLHYSHTSVIRHTHHMVSLLSAIFSNTSLTHSPFEHNHTMSGIVSGSQYEILIFVISVYYKATYYIWKKLAMHG